jgi:hypothetical protein
MLELYERLHSKVRDSRSLVIGTHEYLLSFKLSGWQRFVDAAAGATTSAAATMTTRARKRQPYRRQRR